MTTLKTLFVITVSTVRFFMPGTPAAMNLPDGAKQPGTKSFNVEVVSNVEAGSGARATVSLPEGFKIAGPVDMAFDNNAMKAAANAPGKKTKLLEYWGSGREITGIQPKVTVSDGKQPADEGSLKLPDKSYAYWPTETTKPISAASVQGTYGIKTSFCGNSSVTLSKEQDHLDPIDITNTDGDTDLTKPIVVRWKPVANAAGYILKAYGGDGSQTITWTSSPDLEAARTIEYRALGKDDVEKYLKTGVLIPSYVASCTIPAGIFKGSASVMLVMIAVGKDIVQTDGDTQTSVIVRSTASAPLYSSPYTPPADLTDAPKDKAERK